MKRQALLQTGLSTIFRAVETVSPPLAGKWAVRLFFSPMKYKRPERELAWLKGATIQNVPFSGFYPRRQAESYYRLYQWGAGPTVLLVHGWAGRGSQMAALVKPLVEAGYGVVAFDAPAHGDSPGKRTNILEISQIIREIEAITGGFYAMIGHSFGGVAAAFALNEGAQSQKLVTIGSPAYMDSVFGQFSQQTGASGKALTYLKNHLETMTNRDIDDFSLVNLVSKMNKPGLIIHDQQDREISYTQAMSLSKHWPQSRLILTEGLGHHRILRDAQVISAVLDFVLVKQRQSELN